MLTTAENKKVNRKLAQFQHALGKNMIRYQYDVHWILGKVENINYRVLSTNYLHSKHADWIGNTALHFALCGNDLEAFNILLNYGADFTLQNNNNLTVLHKIIDNIATSAQEKYKLDNPFINSVLSGHLKYRNFQNPSNDNRFSHFHIACAANNVEAVKGFLQSGVSIDQAVKTDSSLFPGFTSLHFAVKYCALEVADLLLTHGANVRFTDARGMTPLHVLLERQLQIVNDIRSDDTLRDTNELILMLFLNKSNNGTMIIDNWGLSQFHVSCTLKDSKVAQYLLQKVVNINHTVSMTSPFWPGYTALHFAALCNVDLVKVLMRKGANISMKDAKGLTPFDMCIERYENRDIYTIISLDSFWKNIILSDGKTRLSDLVFAMRDSNQFDVFLRKLSRNFKICSSPLWPGCTPLHLAVILAKDKVKFNEASERTSLEILRNLCEKNRNMLYSQDVRGRTPLHLAYRLNKKPVLDLLMHFLEECPNFVDRVDEDGLSFVHIASAQNNIHILGRLLTMDININTAYEGQSSIFPNVSRGSTALHFAVINGCTQTVEALMSCGADVNARNAHGMTPIHMVLFGEKRKVGKILLTSPHITESVVDGIGLSHLHIACLCGNMIVVRRLINNGADMNRMITYQPDVNEQSSELTFLKTYAGHSPLSIVCQEHSYRTLELLLQRGANIFIDNPEGKTMLYEIIRTYHTVYFAFFMRTMRENDHLYARLKADTGMTSLHIACLHADLYAIERIVGEGVNVNAQIRSDSPIWQGYTPLHVLIQIYEKFMFNDMNKIIWILLKAGADVTIQNEQSQTVIHMMYEFLCDETDNSINFLSDWRCCINMLFRAQQDFSVNPVNTNGISHFLIACSMCNIGIVQKFLNHCDLIEIDQTIDYFHVDEPGYSALHLVASTDPESFRFSQQLKTIDMLLNYGANVNAEDAQGNTALHKCARPDSLDVFERLVRSGADVNARNILGETPLSCFLHSEDVTVEGIKTLLRFGCHLNTYNAVTHTGYLGETIDVLTHIVMRNLISAIVINFKSEMKVDHLGRAAIHNMVSVKPPKINSINNYISLIEQTSKMGCDIDSQDNLGRTALHIAVKFYNYKAVYSLLLAGADININDNNGRTALAYNSVFCIQCGNGVNQDDGNICKYFETLKILVTHVKKLQLCGLDVNEQNENLAVNALKNFENKNLLTEQFFIELEIIKNKIIESHAITLYDFLCETGAVADYPTMSQIKRKDIKQFFSSDRAEFVKQFPDLAGILQLQYRKARARSKLVESGKNALTVLTGFRFPEICSNYILVLLKNSELKNLIESC